MKLKQRFGLSILILLMIPQLSFSAAAHTGRTDEDGGHTDNETGEYHYHHGYPAHDHYDMDGDGIDDCPYDFDDQTNYQSGTSSGSGYAASGSDGTYSSGFSDGYKRGLSNGQVYGYSQGYREGESAAQEQSARDIEKAKISTYWFTFLPTTAFFLIILFVTHKRNCQALSAAKQDLSKKSMDHQKQVQDLKKTHSLELENSVKMWKKRYHIEQKKNILLQESLNPGNSPLNLPADITLEPFFTPVKGFPSEEYPYGEYTVFLTHSGKKYHADPNCVPGARPYHVFDCLSVSAPCSKCVPPDKYPQALLPWSKQLNKFSAGPTEAQDTFYLMEAANGLTVRVPESKLELWQQAQDRIKRDPEAVKLTENEEKIKAEIMRTIYGPKD